MPARLALAAVLLLALAPSILRARLETPDPPRACAPAGRGEVPLGWIGCAADPGPPRDLAADERLALGLPLDPNTAGARELAFVPGLSRTLAAEVVAERARWPFREVEDLLRVRGIGPRRLERARAFLEVPRPVATGPPVE